MATSKVNLTEGSGKAAATYSVTEDATTKEIQRVSLNNSSGSEISPSTLTEQQTQTTHLSQIETAVETIQSSIATSAKQDEIITAIEGIGISAGSAYSDSGGTDRKGLVDGDRHVQVDVLTDPNLSSATDSVAIGNGTITAEVITEVSDSLGTGNNALVTASEGLIYNSSSTNMNRARTVVNGTDSDGTGIQAVGLVGQLDDTSTSTVTENQFANVRITPKRAVHGSLYTPNGDSAMDETNNAVNVTIKASDVSIGGGDEYELGEQPATPVGKLLAWWNSDLGEVAHASQLQPLPVSATLDTTGLATESKQDDIITDTNTIATNTGGIANLLTEAEFQALVGEVQATPTANTVLDRLKAINTTLQAGIDSNVSGTVTAELSATDNAVLDTIDAVLDTIKTDTAAIVTAVQLIDNSISGSETQVDIVASLPAGTNNIGDVDVLTLPSLPTGSNTIGAVNIAAAQTLATVTTVGTVTTLTGTTTLTPGTGAANLGKAEDAAHASGDTGVAVLERRIDTAATSAGTSGDYATANQSAEGAHWSTLTPTTTSGLTIFRSLDLDETEEEIKSTAGNLYGYYFSNRVASERFLKIYNATAASVTVGTTTPVLTFPLPASATGHIAFPYPISFSTAISAAVTTGIADNDTGAPGANDVVFNAFYK